MFVCRSFSADRAVRALVLQTEFDIRTLSGITRLIYIYTFLGYIRITLHSDSIWYVHVDFRQRQDIIKNWTFFTIIYLLAYLLHGAESFSRS